MLLLRQSVPQSYRKKQNQSRRKPRASKFRLGEGALFRLNPPVGTNPPLLITQMMLRCSG